MRASQLAILLALIAPAAALAYGDRFEAALDEPGAGSGGAVIAERSPYVDGGTRYDYLPVNIYAGEHVYLHSDRLGLKLDLGGARRVDAFLAHRYEGTPLSRAPVVLAGMALREQGADLGIGYRQHTAWGTFGAELLRNVDDSSDGTELRLRWQEAWRRGRTRLWPQVVLAWRDAKLNDYYYGVRADEATATRPVYEAGSGLNLQVGLYASYALSAHWSLLAGVAATRWADTVRDSPITTGGVQAAATLGLLYEHSPDAQAWSASRPLWLKVYYGRATECNLAHIVRLNCTSTQTEQQRVTSLEVGRTLIERLNGWNMDIAGYVGLLHHDEKGYQPDHWQVNAYFKSFWYGLPWRDRVLTRIGLGSGLSYSSRVPWMEVRDQARRGEEINKLVTYLDPTIDFSLGDLVGSKTLKRTFLGLGVSHRSGIFGFSRLLGNVDGGSNYIYAYVEVGI